MTELISRQAALYEIDKNRDALLSSGMTGAEHILVHYGRQVIDELPTIDAVPVVRCKECKYYKESVALSPQKFCFRMKDRYGEATIGYNFAEDDFCSYGERSEDD